MMTTCKNASYTAANVISFRGEVTVPELHAVIKRLDDYIELEGAKKTGEIVTAVHVLYLETSVSDIEIFVAIDKAIPSTETFIFAPSLELTNCLTVKHQKPPYLVPGIYTDIYRKAQEMNLEIEPLFYNVSKGEMSGIWANGAVETDVYVAVKKV